MARVVVVGAGPAGAACSVFLAARGHAVCVVDRDVISSTVDLRVARRRSVPQLRQGHTFLALGMGVLAAEAPQVVDEMLSHGAVKVPLEYSPDLWNILARRPLFDAVLRCFLCRNRRIQTFGGQVVRGLVLERDTSSGIPRVTGVETDQCRIEADIVVDASGQMASLPRWLAERGVKLPTFQDPTSFFYLTQHYRLRRGASFPTAHVPIVVALDFATALAFPEDNGHYQLTVQLDVREPFKRQLRIPEKFVWLLGSMPAFVPWLSVGEPVGMPEPIGGPGNRRRSLSDGSSPCVEGLLLVGDAAVQTNPTAGRGISLALVHAQALARMLDERSVAPIDLASLAECWEQRTSALLGPWLKTQVAIDQERRKQIRASLEGGDAMHGNVRLPSLPHALQAASATSAIVGSARERLFNMVATPDEIYSDREVARCVIRQMRATRDVPYEGPARKDFERRMLAAP